MQSPIQEVVEMKVVHFEIPAVNPNRAGDFYSKVFGWKISKWDGPMDYWMIDTGKGKGINGGLMKKSGPVKSTSNTIEVKSVDRFCSKIAENGGKCITPKQAIPGHGFFAYFRDTEGNISGLMQQDKSAK